MSSGTETQAKRESPDCTAQTEKKITSHHERVVAGIGQKSNGRCNESINVEDLVRLLADVEVQKANHETNDEMNDDADQHQHRIAFQKQKISQHQMNEL